MLFGAAIVVLLAVNAVAAIVACYKLGAFSGAISALRADSAREADTNRRHRDHVTNHVMTLGEKVDKGAAQIAEVHRLLKPRSPLGSRPEG